MKYSMIRLSLSLFGMFSLSAFLKMGILSAENGMISGFILGACVYTLIRDERL